ncbi:exported hypothetical protein [Xanthomonas citri pv. fuscans]|nr:exported hypothetical protein [Xanthomonas citri pv. fuscans]SOO03737.1 exported hypothetical protein [Xanthomonas citri pv. fuscans]SOO04986.1 exported hypothetical protein [Xanthomonas citri pv. fuscans]SOO11541.1 exported hypothetical protein [Xanthomonas citri pv. fuscans]SOO12708.1 exported hypothetical protein [Xanthomonas citri pv. fuscans]
MSVRSPRPRPSACAAGTIRPAWAATRVTRTCAAVASAISKVRASSVAGSDAASPAGRGRDLATDCRRLALAQPASAAGVALVALQRRGRSRHAPGLLKLGARIGAGRRGWSSCPCHPCPPAIQHLSFSAAPVTTSHPGVFSGIGAAATNCDLST